jgi:hypothetical protein
MNSLRIYQEIDEKPPREFLDFLGGFTGSFFGNPTFSFYSPEGQRLG